MGKNIEVLLEASRVLAIAIRHSQLEQRVKLNLRGLEALRKIDRIMLQQLDLESSSETILQTIIDTTAVDAAALTLYDEESKRFKLVALMFLDGKVIREQVFQIDESLREHLFEHRETVVIHEIESDGRLRLSHMPSGKLLRMHIGVPLIAHHRAIGALHI